MLEKFSKLFLRDTFSLSHPKEYRIAQYLVLSISIISMFVLLFALCLVIPVKQAPFAIFMLLAPFLYLSNLLLLRLTGSLAYTGATFVLEQCIVIFVLSYLYGANRLEFYIWYPSAILIATFVLGKRWGLATVVLMVVSVTYLEYLGLSGHHFPGAAARSQEFTEPKALISVLLALLATAFISWLFEDIREIAENRLRSSERRLRMHVEQTQLAVIETNNQSCITAWNPAAELIFGYRSEEAIGRNIVDLLVLPEHRPAISALLNRLRYNRDVILNSNQNITKSGHVISCDWYNTPLVDENNDIIGKAAMAVDVTKRKEYEEELRQAKELAEESTRAKSEFLARMSHEIRTPMNGVIGMTNLLLETRLEPEQRDFVETIRHSSESLLSIINEILDFSKIESGKMDLEAQPFNLPKCIEGALDLLALQAAAKHLELAYLLEAQVPTMLIGDVTRLRQVLVNLLSNAVKFTASGEVYVHGALKARDGNQVELQFSVRDTGIGIPEDKLSTLFQSFNQVNSSTTREFGGTGLGLVISKRLCELMGGDMWVQSSAGQGSTFYFTIRTSIDAAASTTETPDTALAMQRILIVDDNAMSRHILKQHTMRWQMKPLAVGSGTEAVDLIKRGEKFDIALLNMTMSELDGIVLAQQIRQLRPTETLPLIILTSISGSGIRQRAENLAIAAFLYKPVKPKELRDVLISRLYKAPSMEQPNSKSIMNNNEPTNRALAQTLPLKILLAEDNLINQKVALRILARLGYQADAVANGREAVEALRRQPYDVILMDMHMPEMDGLEATRRILREYTGDKPPYIVAMTAAAMPTDKVKCQEAGMHDFLAKPIQLNELMNLLQSRQAPSTATAE
ncbi:MAG: response regulator [Caldilineaceae bacterium]